MPVSPPSTDDSFVAVVLFVVVEVVLTIFFIYSSFPLSIFFFQKSLLPVFGGSSAFKRTLCGGQWSLYFTSSTGTNGRYGCCDAGTYMAFPELNPFVKANACQNCPSGQFTYDENDATSCLTSKVLPNSNGLSTNAGHNLRHIVLEWVAGRTSEIIEGYGHISDWNVSHITNMKNLFYNTPAIADDISKWQTGSVTTMESMFRSNSAFNSDISAWNTGAVTSMGSSKSFIE